MGTKVYHARELETFLPPPTFVDNNIPPNYYMSSCSYESNLKQYLLNNIRSAPRYGSLYTYDRYIPTPNTRSMTDKKQSFEPSKHELLEPVKADPDPEKQEFDPFKARDQEHAVTNCATLTHLLKSALGTGILAMPAAFKASGLWMGVIITILVAIICTYCSYMLVACAHKLYRSTKRTKMTYAEVAEEACLHGPVWCRKYGFVAKQIVVWGIFLTYFTAASCYTVIVAQNFNYVLASYIGTIDKRITIASLFIPLLLMAYIPNLKYLAPLSMVANVCIGFGLAITCYYLLSDIPSVTERPAIASFSTFPICISIVIFAIEAIGVIMPLENNMKTPQQFIGLFGVLNQGMAYVTVLYIVIGCLGYVKYGEDTADLITLNLPRDEILAQAVNVLIALAVFFTYGLVFYVCLDISWNEMKNRFTKNEKLANYSLRTILVIISVLIGIVVPEIIPFVSLIGAFFFSILGLICPVFIEILTFWDDGFGKYNWKIFKHVVIIITAMIALIFGSKSAIEDIIKTFY